jgi:hypothetical protein
MAMRWGQSYIQVLAFGQLTVWSCLSSQHYKNIVFELYKINIIKKSLLIAKNILRNRKFKIT